MEETSLITDTNTTNTNTTNTTNTNREECQELKNIKYKTMLLNGNPNNSTKSSDNISNLDKFLEMKKRLLTNGERSRSIK